MGIIAGKGYNNSAILFFIIVFLLLFDGIGIRDPKRDIEV